MGGVPIAGAGNPLPGMGNPLPGMGMLGQVQLRKVEKPPEGTEKKSISGAGGNIPTTNTNTTAPEKQNLNHLSNLMVQGAINRKSKLLQKRFFDNIFKN